MAAARLSLQALLEWTAGLQAVLGGDDWLVAEPIVRDLRVRVERLVEVGLGYLTPEQGTPSLSAGEAQRLRLAQLLGSGLTGVLYILDEPTIGLHPRDTPRLIRMLKALRDLENTVLVIEHDLEMIAAADWVVDFGPGGGRYGGQVTAAGHAGGGGGQPAVGDRALPGRGGGDPPAATAAAVGRAVPDGPRRARAQPAEHHRAVPAAGERRPVGDARGGERRVGVGQVDADVRHPGPGGAAALLWGERGAGGARRDRRLGARRQDHHDRPGAAGADHAFERGHVQRGVHGDPRGVCGAAGGAGAWAEQGALLL